MITNVIFKDKSCIGTSRYETYSDAKDAAQDTLAMAGKATTLGILIVGDDGELIDAFRRANTPYADGYRLGDKLAAYTLDVASGEQWSSLEGRVTVEAILEDEQNGNVMVVFKDAEGKLRCRSRDGLYGFLNLYRRVES